MVSPASQNSRGESPFYLTKYLRLIIDRVEVRGVGGPQTGFEVPEHRGKSQRYSDQLWAPFSGFSMWVVPSAHSHCVVSANSHDYLSEGLDISSP